MFVWELIADRLRCEGWSVWHWWEQAAAEPSYTVVIHRPGAEWRATGPTLTEALGAAARRAHAHVAGAKSTAAPHFAVKSANIASPAA
jgi:hypothetical protein